MSNKAQMHFEVDHELKAHWKAFFALLPRKSETRILTELMRNFLEKAKKQYKDDDVLSRMEDETPPESLQRIKPFNVLKEMEEQNDPGANAVDKQGNREGGNDESGVAVSGSYAGINRDREREFLYEKPDSEDPGTQS